MISRIKPLVRASAVDIRIITAKIRSRKVQWSSINPPPGRRCAYENPGAPLLQKAQPLESGTYVVLYGGKGALFYPPQKFHFKKNLRRPLDPDFHGFARINTEQPSRNQNSFGA